MQSNNINFDFKELIGIKISEFKKGEVIRGVIAKKYLVLVQPTKQCNMLEWDNIYDHPLLM